MIFNTLCLLALGVNAAIVTDVVQVTQYVYEDVHVYVDGNNNPVSTSTDLVDTTGPATAAAETATVSSVPSAASSLVSSVDAAASSSAASSVAASSSVVATASSAAPSASSAASSAPAASSSATGHSHSSALNYIYISSSDSSSAAAASTSSVETSPEATSEAPTTSSYVAPTTSQAPTTSSYVAPAETSSVETSSAVTTSSSYSAPASSSSSAASSSSTSSSDSYSGDATYYDVGLGACGITNTDSDYIVALNVDQFNSFGSMSNGNPVCNKQIEITRPSNGKTVKVTVTDKCPGCSYGDLDLSPAAFQEIADEAEGRVKITWVWA